MSVSTLKVAMYDILNNAEADVYPLVAPQELTDPYAVYSSRIELVRAQGSVPIKDYYLTLNIYANVLTDAINLADAFSSVLDNLSGTFEGEELEVGLFLTESDDFIPDLDKYVITQERLFRFH